MKTFNVYWCMITVLLIWFLLIHSPIYLVQRLRSNERSTMDIPFAVHLLGAYTMCFACIMNTLITPSTFNGKGRQFHIPVGLIGMAGGVFAFVLGVYCCWWPWRPNLPPTSFSIGITIGGFNQMYFQYFGYAAIKKYQYLKLKITETEQEMFLADTQDHNSEELQRLEQAKQSALQIHIEYMIALFVCGCGAPPLIRIVAEVLSDYGLLSLFLAIGVLIMVATFYAKTLVAMMVYSNGPEQFYIDQGSGAKVNQRTSSRTQKRDTNYRTID